VPWRGPDRLHEEISGDSPTCIDLLNHFEGKGAAPSQDFAGARTRAENVSRLCLSVTEFLDRVAQHVHRVESAAAPEGPAPFLIGLDQRHKNVELVDLCTPTRRPQSLSISASASRWFLGLSFRDVCGHRSAPRGKVRSPLRPDACRFSSKCSTDERLMR
jgi:hypothetical protein